MELYILIIALLTYESSCTTVVYSVKADHSNIHTCRARENTPMPNRRSGIYTGVKVGVLNCNCENESTMLCLPFSNKKGSEYINRWVTKDTCTRLQWPKNTAMPGNMQGDTTKHGDKTVTACVAQERWLFQPLYGYLSCKHSYYYSHNAVWQFISTYSPWNV